MRQMHVTDRAGRSALRTGHAVLILAAAFWATAGAATARAGVFTGDPATDGWAQRGTSTSLGVVVDNMNDPATHPLYNYGIYALTFQVTAGDGIANGVIHNGDIVIGVGAVMRQAYDLNKAQVKFSDGSATFAPSTYVPGSPGHEHDLGDGVSGVAFSGPHGFLANISGILTWATAAPEIVTEMQGSDMGAVPGYVPGGVLFTSKAMAGGELASFELIVDNAAMGPGWTALVPGSEFIVTAQHETTPCNFTNALGTTFTFTPEPATILLMALGGAAVLIRRRLRRSRR
jgi:hypothetical protein